MLLLDKAMSGTINRDFFQHEVPYETEEVRGDGRVIVHQQGILQLLEDWVRKHFRLRDPEPLERMFAAFREVRLRQRPAPTVDEDSSDPDLVRSQRDLMIRAYDAVRTLRLILA